MKLSRIKQLAGLKEANPPTFSSHGQIDDDETRQDNARYDRERKVRIVIKTAFKRIGLQINTDANMSDGIFYSEEDTREAIVSLYENEIDLDSLLKLKQSGLSNQYVIEAGNHELDIKFNVSPEIDQVVMKG